MNNHAYRNHVFAHKRLIKVPVGEDGIGHPRPYHWALRLHFFKRIRDSILMSQGIPQRILLVIYYTDTVNSLLADTSLLRPPPLLYRQQQNPQGKLQTFDWNKLPLLLTLATTDLGTLYSVPMSQFYCFLSRYSGHRAASWNICTHIKSILSAFWDCLFLFGPFPLLLSINQNPSIFFF